MRPAGALSTRYELIPVREFLIPGLHRVRALDRPPTGPRATRPEDRLRGLAAEPAPAKARKDTALCQRIYDWMTFSYVGTIRKRRWGALIEFVPLGVLGLLAIFVAGCSDSTPVAPAGNTLSAEMVEKNCADPKWKDKNLGLWYSICRRPMNW
jgi:hypothetical protein